MRKERICALVLFACLSALPSVSAYAEQAVVTGDEVNVRNGPGTVYGISTSVNRDTVVEILDRSNPDWYQISWDGGSGYVSSQFLSITEDSLVSGSSGSGGSTVFVVQEPGVSTPGETLPQDQLVYVPTDGTIHTDGPFVPPSPTPTADLTAGDHSSAGSDVSGTLITVTEPRFVIETVPTPKPSELPEAFLSVGEPKPLPQNVTGQMIAPIEAPAAEAVGNQAETSRMFSAGNSAAETDAASAQRLKLGQVTGNAVRLRTGPGSSYSIIGTYDEGTEVTISGISGEWVAVSLPAEHVNGYIFSDFIEELSPDSAAEANASMNSGVATGNYAPSSDQIKDGYITGTGVRLRESPSMSAKILDELNYGTAVRITGVSQDWLRVIANGKDGYVSAPFVTEGTYAPESGLSSASGTELGKEIAAYALQYVGTPYKWGGKSPETGFDCSGFVQYVFGQFGLQTSRVSNDALSDGVHVDPADLQPGDLLCFYSGNNYVGHLGIYVGDDLFIHAANSDLGVVTTSLTTGYYASRGYEIRRLT